MSPYDAVTECIQEHVKFTIWLIRQKLIDVQPMDLAIWLIALSDILSFRETSKD